MANGPGSWNFSDLHTGDASAATDFYAAAFGWEVDDLGFARVIRLPGYGDHIEATVDPDIRRRQAEVATPPGFEDAVGWLAETTPGEEPHWHVTFSVADRDDTVGLAERLGAQVRETSETEWARTALLRDPQGAGLTVSQFTPPSG